MTLVINPQNFMELYALYRFNRPCNNKRSINKYELCIKQYQKKKDIRCGGIIINKNFDSVIIVLNRDSKMKGEDKWGLPKGHIKEGEELFQCAEREIEEETGLKIKINDKNPRIKINDTYYYIIVMNEDISLVPKDKREIAEVKWEKIENMNQINTNRGLRKLDSVYPKIIKLAKRKINENNIIIENYAV